MNYKEKIAWLRRYRYSMRLERMLREECEELGSRAEKVTTFLSGTPGGSTDGQALPRAVERLVQAQQELQDQIDKCSAIRHEIVTVINQVSDPRGHEILRRRYLMGQKWDEVSESMNIDLRWAHKLHKRVLESMSISHSTKVEYL